MRLSVLVFSALMLMAGSLAHAANLPSECVQELSDNFKLSRDSSDSCTAACTALQSEFGQRLFTPTERREHKACIALEILAQSNPMDACRWIGTKSRVWEVTPIESQFLGACAIRAATSF